MATLFDYDRPLSLWSVRGNHGLVIEVACQLILTLQEHVAHNYYSTTALLLYFRGIKILFEPSAQHFSSLVGVTPFGGIVDILNEKDGGDSELCLFAMTLINKVRLCAVG